MSPPFWFWQTKLLTNLNEDMIIAVVIAIQAIAH